MAGVLPVGIAAWSVIPTGSTPAKIPPRDHSNRFDDEGTIIDPKADTEGKELVVGGKQDSVRGRPKCYNGFVQLVQLKHLPHHREEAGTGVPIFVDAPISGAVDLSFSSVSTASHHIESA